MNNRKGLAAKGATHKIILDLSKTAPPLPPNVTETTKHAQTRQTNTKHLLMNLENRVFSLRESAGALLTVIH